MQKKQIKRHAVRGIQATRGERIFYSCNNILMLILMFFTFYPMLYVVFCSFSDPSAFAMVKGPLWRPAGFSFVGYETVFNMSTIWLGYRNTLIYVFVGSILSMSLTIMAAFVLSRKEFVIKRVILWLIVFTMYFGGGMIPTFLVVSQLKLTKTIWGVMLPGCISVYNTIVLRTSFNSVPTALSESAYIDGAGDFKILIHVVLPLSGAAIATISLFYIVGNWGAWYNALVYLQDRRTLYPLQMYLRELLIEDTSTDAYITAQSGKAMNQHLIKEITKYSVIIVSTLPILIVYPFIQKYFVKGVMLGAIKE